MWPASALTVSALLCTSWCQLTFTEGSHWPWNLGWVRESQGIEEVRESGKCKGILLVVRENSIIIRLWNCCFRLEAWLLFWFIWIGFLLFILLLLNCKCLRKCVQIIITKELTKNYLKNIAVTSDGQGAFSDIGKAGEFHSGRWVGKPCYYCLMVFAYSFCVFVLSDASVGKWSVRFISESDLYLGPWADGPQAHTDSPSVWHRLPCVRSRWPFSCFCWYVHDICWLNSKLEAPVFNIFTEYNNLF